MTWRVAGNDCGWAPLPLNATFDVATGFRFNGVSVGANYDFGLLPGLFSFVAMNDFCQPDLARRCLPPVEVTRIYNNATIINNYAVGKDRLIVNNGIPVELIRQVTRAPIQPVAVRDVPAGTRIQAGTGPATVVYRHDLPAPVKMASIVAQKIDDRHPTIQPAMLTPVNGTSRPRQGNSAVVVNPAPVAPRNENPKATPPANISKAPRGQTSKSATDVEIGETIYLHGKPGDSPVLPPKKEAVGAPALPEWEGNSRVYQAKGHTQTTEAHALPPLNDPDSRSVPEETYPPGKNPHVYSPKIQRNANQAHALPPMNIPPSAPKTETPPPNPYKVTSPKAGQGH